jgi:hypothetical protein
VPLALTERNRAAQELFAPVGPTYDRYARLLSFGQDPRWRAFLVSRIEAEPGDTVLLAPACASFDMFQSFEHRGRVFKEEVERLKKSGVRSQESEEKHALPSSC